MGMFILILVSASLITYLHAVPVTIYYEALCYDSVQFITKQLYPHYNDLKDHLTIDFVPYGKAMHSFNESTDKYRFSCQHGPSECKGNKFQACGLDQINEQDTQVDFVNCVMKSKNPSNIFYIEDCARQFHLDFNKLSVCVASNQGDKLLAASGDKTWSLEPNLSYVPTIVLNNSLIIDPANQNLALSNFKTLICNHITDTKPKICNDAGILKRIKNFFY